MPRGTAPGANGTTSTSPSFGIASGRTNAKSAASRLQHPLYEPTQTASVVSLRRPRNTSSPTNGAFLASRHPGETDDLRSSVVKHKVGEDRNGILATSSWPSAACVTIPTTSCPLMRRARPRAFHIRARTWSGRPRN